MAYGILAKAAGMSDNLMQVGAGGYNLIEAIGGKDTLNDIRNQEYSEALSQIKKVGNMKNIGGEHILMIQGTMKRLNLE